MDSDSKHEIEYLKSVLPDLYDLDDGEFLAQQESVYHYIKSNKQQNSRFDYGQSSNSNNNNNNDDNELSALMESPMDYDEALARALEMDDGFNQLHISHPAPNSLLDNPRSNVREPHVEAHEQDAVDPDNMSYEELQSLGDAVGHESKGLSKEALSRLPTSKYKIGSSTNKEKQECVICCEEFEKGQEVTTLPCAHFYHSDCINKSLEVKKNCPVCQKEVEQQ